MSDQGVPARVEVNRGFPHLVLDGGGGAGEWHDHQALEVFANIAGTVTLDLDLDAEGRPCAVLTPAEARALAALLTAAADEAAARALAEGGV